MNVSKWTQWTDIRIAAFGDRRLVGYGVYEIRAVTPNRKPISINRVRASDPEGILYIGRSGFKSRSPLRTVANRIKEFLGQRHSGGITYAKARDRLNRAPPFAGHTLEARAMFVPDKSIVFAERRVLAQYFAKYAELPPCNSSAGTRSKRGN